LQKQWERCSSPTTCWRRLPARPATPFDNELPRGLPFPDPTRERLETSADYRPLVRALRFTEKNLPVGLNSSGAREMSGGYWKRAQSFQRANAVGTASIPDCPETLFLTNRPELQLVFPAVEGFREKCAGSAPRLKGLERRRTVGFGVGHFRGPRVRCSRHENDAKSRISLCSWTAVPGPSGRASTISVTKQDRWRRCAGGKLHASGGVFGFDDLVAAGPSRNSPGRFRGRPAHFGRRTVSVPVGHFARGLGAPGVLRA